MGRAEFLDETPERPAKRARHVAIIMDGNGRWATRRGLPRLAGHRKGADAVRSVVEACPDLGVEVLTLYAFSTENWKRSVEEIAGLMNLFRRYMRREAAELSRRGARVVFIGDREGLAPDIRELMAGLEAQTASNDRLTLVIAINYGGRAEIAAAARRLAKRAAAGEIEPEAVDEAALDAALDTGGLPDPDLLIRTSGEQRISNFLLWQCAYAEFMFVDELWPDFGREALARALAAYGARERRFGAVAI
ncbi:di-trans,poly-cis-decaprenylcistransferase [Pikeienuella piscinae]|uniref:Isoprenyl transferase n=1 Tax=Pikeienuella piscinae TaxID=2748098 RepID=A0A7L5C1Q6_9RHOB|nr:polyprenyl diphosphate synthase [Pikeienuella piscinae]QIE56084.1 di-trans,poly-cis-decaprenylcistransferase [Pikeienuella piscinae]